MKRIFIALCTLFFMFLFTSCNIDDFVKDNNTKENIPSQRLYEPDCEEIIRCFNERDVEGLKLFLNPEVAHKYDVETQIKEAFELISSDIVEYEIGTRKISGDSFRNGKIGIVLPQNVLKI
ncbi:hypothetical protein FACS1894132_13650 [Clostridia bacterium]|nr:hypothetical protein FACS1894132_13650 [Clostridia bacterium]